MNAKAVYDLYSDKFTLSLEMAEQMGIMSSLPVFSKEFMLQFIDEALDVMKRRGPIIKADGPCVIVGDLHGNIHDLVRIIISNGIPPSRQYLFLGDYVDRGEFSIEVVTLLLTLHTLFPHSVHMIRGNHEVRKINKQYGFMEEIESEYGDKILWEKFNEVFDWMPLSCILNNSILCVHGGISPYMFSRSSLEKIPLPLKEATPLVNDILWSDPVQGSSMFADCPRGSGHSYGINATFDILKKLNCVGIIRGHEAIRNGVQWMHSDKVITVFSSSNYCNENTVCGFLIVSQFVDERTLPLMQTILRNDVTFVPAKRMTNLPSMCIALNNKRITEKRKSQKHLLRNGVTRILPKPPPSVRVKRLYHETSKGKGF